METRSGKVVVIIPALNEDQALPKVLAAIPREWVDAVVVVDNGSTDRTPLVAQQLGAAVVAEPQRGYGAAMWRGMQEVESRWPDTQAVVFLDGDAADDPQRIGELVGPVLSGKADFVLGSRLLGCREPGALPLHSRMGNCFACWCLKLLTGQRYTDLGPFRAVRWSELQRLHMQDRNFGWTVEMQIKAARAGLTIAEIPVPYRKRVGKSKISGTWIGSFRASYKILYTLAKYALVKTEPPPLQRAGDAKSANPTAHVA